MYQVVDNTTKAEVDENPFSSASRASLDGLSPIKEIDSPSHELQSQQNETDNYAEVYKDKDQAGRNLHRYGLAYKVKDPS